MTHMVKVFASWRRLDFFCQFTSAILLGSFFANAAMAKRPATAHDILTFKNVTQVALSADGRSIAYTVTVPGSTGSRQKGETSIYFIDSNGGSLGHLDLGMGPTVRNLSWSPSGRFLGYLSPGKSGATGFWLYDSVFRTTREVTVSEEGVEDGQSIQYYSWSPQGRRIAYIASAGSQSGYLEMSRPEPIEIMGVNDATGLALNLANRDRYLAVLDIDTKENIRLTDNNIIPEFARPLISWSGDSRKLVFSARNGRVNQINDAYKKLELYTAVVSEAKAIRFGGLAGPDESPVFDRHGGIFFVGGLSASSYASDSAIRYMKAPNSSVATKIDDIPQDTRLEMLTKRSELLIAQRVSANRRLFLAAENHAQVRSASPPNMHVVDYSLASDQDTVAVILSSANELPEIYLGSLHSAKFRRLTNVYKRERETLDLATVDRIQWPSSDGLFEIDGFLIKPANFDPQQKYPLLVNIHGGPGADFMNDFFSLRFNPAVHSHQEYYAARGYLILNTNHRGSSTYGSKFRESIKGHYNATFDLDITPGIDYVIQQGFVDSNKIGLMGASYGGYAAAWGLTRTSRFKAASINDSMFNLISFYGTAVEGQEGKRYYMNGNPIQNYSKYVAESPLFFAENIKTPLLIRCGSQTGTVFSSAFCSQSLELHTALTDLDVPVELIIHPYEAHGIVDQATSKDYLERNVDWFDFWLSGKKDPDLRKTKQYDRWRLMNTKHTM
jgi:dipeptidyl aminopeptidase/acylaminoacyl peptidase